MPNTILTDQAITREALRILHQKCNFIGSINRQYDKSFANEGAKVGDSIRIRLPNQYTVRSGATLAVQDTVEQNTTLQVVNQKGVDLNFSSAELTLSMDDFSSRILDPAMAVLASALEADAFNMVNDIQYQVGAPAGAVVWKDTLSARKVLTDNLTPQGKRKLILNTQHNLDMVDNTKTLFNDSNMIAKQYKEGMLGRTASFEEVYENTILPSFTNGAGVATGYVTTAIGVELATSVPVGTGTGALNKGQVFTFAGVFDVHPETKLSTGKLKQFVVSANYAGGAGTLNFLPALVAGNNGRKNISALPASGAGLTFGTPNQTFNQSIAFHEDAFTFATVDLVKPQGVDFCAREVYDGISMRIVRAYDINNDLFPCRLDVMYGYKTLRSQLACRIAGL